MPILDGKIIKARILKVWDIFKMHKPAGLSMTDTEAIVLDIEVEGDEVISETLYACLLPDGRINTNEISSRSAASQKRLAYFISKYISKDTANYNVKKNITKWAGIPVKLEQKGGFIFLA